MSNSKLAFRSRFGLSSAHFLCTGAVKTNVVHRRGVFAKRCKTIARVSENRSSANSSKTRVKMPSLRKNRRTPRAVWPLFFRCVRRRPPKAKNVNSSPSPAQCRAHVRPPPARLPDPPGRLPDAWLIIFAPFFQCRVSPTTNMYLYSMAGQKTDFPQKSGFCFLFHKPIFFNVSCEFRCRPMF